MKTGMARMMGIASHSHLLLPYSIAGRRRIARVVGSPGRGKGSGVTITRKCRQGLARCVP